MIAAGEAYNIFRGGPRTAATSKMNLSVIIADASLLVIIVSENQSNI